MRLGKERRYLAGGGSAVGDHVGEAGDDVDGEADEESANGGVDGAEEREDDGEEPDGDDDGEAGEGAKGDAFGVVNADHLLPDEVERRTGEAEGDELVDQHQHHRRVAPPRLRKQRKGVGVVEKAVAERPVHGGGGRQSQGEDVESCHEVDELELLRLPHGVHYLTEAKASLDLNKLITQKNFIKKLEVFFLGTIYIEIDSKLKPNRQNLKTLFLISHLLI